jgi:hypothetical protein|tara:strand:+ start:1971 stop:2141 length:171 start_codon:yes stop_codon:yes gene_type:complete
MEWEGGRTKPEWGVRFPSPLGIENPTKTDAVSRNSFVTFRTFRKMLETLMRARSKY